MWEIEKEDDLMIISEGSAVSLIVASLYLSFANKRTAFSLICPDSPSAHLMMSLCAPLLVCLRIRLFSVTRTNVLEPTARFHGNQASDDLDDEAATVHNEKKGSSFKKGSL